MAAPAGLAMSLDDMIKSRGKEAKVPKTQAGAVMQDAALDDIIKSRKQVPTKPQKPSAPEQTTASRGRGGRQSVTRGGPVAQAANRGVQQRLTKPIPPAKGNHQSARGTTQQQQHQRGGYNGSTLRVQTSRSSHDAQRRQVVVAGDGSKPLATRTTYPGQQGPQQAPRVSVHNRIQQQPGSQQQRQHQQPSPQEQQQQMLLQHIQLQEKKLQQQELQLQRLQYNQQRQQEQQQQHAYQQQQQRRFGRPSAASYMVRSPPYNHNRNNDDVDEGEEDADMQPRRRQAAASAREDARHCLKAMVSVQDPNSGDTTVTHHGTVVAVVSGGSGEVVLLPEGGERSKGLYDCLQLVLLPIGFQISSNVDRISAGEWNITGASAMVKLKDGLLLPAKGPATTKRAGIIHNHLCGLLQEAGIVGADPRGAAALHHLAHQAATLASTQAAAELGILQAKGPPAATLQQQQQQQLQFQLQQQQLQQQLLMQLQQGAALGALPVQAPASDGAFVPMAMMPSMLQQQLQQQQLQQQQLQQQQQMGHGKEQPTRSTIRYVPY